MAEFGSGLFLIGLLATERSELSIPQNESSDTSRSRNISIVGELRIGDWPRFNGESPLKDKCEVKDNS